MQRWIPPASIVLVSTTPILHRDHTLEIPPPSNSANRSSFYAVLYLCSPRDTHRIVSPAFPSHPIRWHVPPQSVACAESRLCCSLLSQL
jgi:phosphatidylserine decarboxylase